MAFNAFDAAAMLRAIELARLGEGHVEPNPMVGAVIASGGTGAEIIAAGWHGRFGKAHAEIAALASAGAAAHGATLYVTLEPCCHHGQTPPCTSAIIAAGIRRVVVATSDPFPAVNGGGIAALQAAGITVEVGLHAQEARRITAPFCKLIREKKPWVIAKWAMSLDGCMATDEPESRWISSLESRALVHQLRGRMDAIIVGIGTALADNPLLTARPAGPRQPLRIVLDSHARLPLTSQLVQSARAIPVLVAVGPDAPAEQLSALKHAGCEIWLGHSHQPSQCLQSLLVELGLRRQTNVLVEGGPTLLRSLFDNESIDEVWAFIAPKILGRSAGLGAGAGPGAGPGVYPDVGPGVDMDVGQRHAPLFDAPLLDIEHVSHPGDDIFIRGLVRTSEPKW